MTETTTQTDEPSTGRKTLAGLVAVPAAIAAAVPFLVVRNGVIYPFESIGAWGGALLVGYLVYWGVLKVTAGYD